MNGSNPQEQERRDPEPPTKKKLWLLGVPSIGFFVSAILFVALGILSHLLQEPAVTDYLMIAVGLIFVAYPFVVIYFTIDVWKRNHEQPSHPLFWTLGFFVICPFTIVVIAAYWYFYFYLPYRAHQELY